MTILSLMLLSFAAGVLVTCIIFLGRPDHWIWRAWQLFQGRRLIFYSQDPWGRSKASISAVETDKKRMYWEPLARRETYPEIGYPWEVWGREAEATRAAAALGKASRDV